MKHSADIAVKQILKVWKQLRYSGVLVDCQTTGTPFRTRDQRCVCLVVEVGVQDRVSLSLWALKGHAQNTIEEGGLRQTCAKHC